MSQLAFGPAGFFCVGQNFLMYIREEKQTSNALSYEPVEDSQTLGGDAEYRGINGR